MYDLLIRIQIQIIVFFWVVAHFGLNVAAIFRTAAGANGKPVAMLSIGKGTTTSSDLKGPLAGKEISHLINMMKSGGAYVNSHTAESQWRNPRTNNEWLIEQTSFYFLSIISGPPLLSIVP